MRRILILVTIALFSCSTAGAFQGGGGESTRKGSNKKKTDSKKISGTKSVNTQPPSGTWFVILGSYPKAERSKADQRLNYIKDLGYEAYIVDTNNYSNLRSGLWAVVMGPYKKQRAKEVVANLRPKVHDVYIK